jgi:hypothetical protein
MTKKYTVALFLICLGILSARLQAQSLAAALDSSAAEMKEAVKNANGVTAVLPEAPAVKVVTSVEVRANDANIQEALAPSPSISQAQLLSSAGTYGDLSRYLQVLPGVVWNSDLSNEVLVRGGNPLENLFVVDGIEIPNINHFALAGSNGGFTSMLDATAVGSMEMRAGVYDASYSSRLSSLIDIHTRQLGEGEQAGDISLGIAGAGGLYQRALKRNGSFLLSAHRSILNLFTNDVGINGVPAYTNGLAKMDLSPSSRDTLSLLSLSGADSISMMPCPADKQESSPYQTEYAGWRTTEALNWRHLFAPRIISNLTASTSLTRQKIGQQQQFSYKVVDGQNTCQANKLTTVYGEDSRDNLSALNYGLQADIHGWLFSTGAGGRLTTPNDSVSQPNGELSPFSASTTASDAVTFHSNFSTGQAAGYLQAEGSLGPRWRLLAGLRAESFAITGSYALDPRLSATYRLNAHQSLHASMGISSQLPPMMDMISYQSNHALRPIQVRQAAIGMRLWQGNWGTLDAEAYDKHYSKEPVSTEYPQLMLSNMIDTLGQEFVWLPLTSAGTANARGLELALRAHWSSRMQGLFSLTRSQTSYRALDGVRRPGNYDIPVIANAMASVRLPRSYKLDIRETASSGRLYTPFNFTASDQQDRGIYDLASINARRAPLYNRLDLEVERQFHLRSGVIDLHAGADNLLNRDNFLGYVYLSNCSLGLSIPCVYGSEPVGKITQMGLYPSMSVRFRF